MSIMQSLLREPSKWKDTLETVADVDPENMKKAVAAMSDYQELVENASGQAAERPTGTWDSFMRWLRWRMYGCFIGLGSAMVAANLSTLAARQCISGTQTEDDTYGADLFFYTSFLNVVILIVLLQICTSDGISGKHGKKC